MTTHAPFSRPRRLVDVVDVVIVVVVVVVVVVVLFVSCLCLGCVLFVHLFEDFPQHLGVRCDGGPRLADWEWKQLVRREHRRWEGLEDCPV